MPNLRSNPNAGSVLLKAIDSGKIQTIDILDIELGHFQVDHDAQVFLVPARRSGLGWRATLGPSLLKKVAGVQPQAKAHHQRELFADPYFVDPYLWLACSGDCCELWPSEWTQVIDVHDRTTEQHIQVERPPNCSFRVRGDAGELPHTIPLKRFPSLAVAA